MKFTNMISAALVVLFLFSFAFLAEAVETRNNYPQYKLENVISYQVTEGSKILYTLTRTEGGLFFDSRELSTGISSLHTRLDFPVSRFLNTVLIGRDLYIFQATILDREKRLLETTIFKVDGTTGKTETVFHSTEMKDIAERFYATRDGLLLTGKRGGNPSLYNISSGTMEAINLEDDMRIRAFDREKNCAIIVRQSNFSTNSSGNEEKSTYTEGDGSLLDVYCCDFSRDYDLTVVGQYQPSFVISKSEAETSLPYFKFSDDKFAWIAHSFIVNQYPIYPAGLMMDKDLHSLYLSLIGSESITAISFAADKYALAMRYADSGDFLFNVYNLENPLLEKIETVSLKDRQKIQALLQKDLTVEKRLIDPDKMGRIFDARFYEIDLVTTIVDSSDGGVSTYSETSSFLAVGHDGVYSVLKQNEELVPLIADGFVLNEASALQFQDALDGLFPVGHFAGKHKTFNKKDGHWEFVRDESFGELEGFKVMVDDEGRVMGIGAEGKFSEE